MKIAIIGCGPNGLFAAKHFQNLGALVTVFSERGRGGLLYQCKHLNSEWEQFYQNEFLPTLQSLQHTDVQFKKVKVLRIQKRYLHKNEKPHSGGRLIDLFRVVYSSLTEENSKELEEQIAQNPQAFAPLGDEVIASLKQSIESYEDFDLVIDASGSSSSIRPMGAGGTWALNEMAMERMKGQFKTIFYGLKDSVDQEHKLGWTSSQLGQRVLIVGHSPLAAQAFLQLRKWKKEVLLVYNLEAFCSDPLDAWPMGPYFQELRRQVQLELREEEKEWKQSTDEYQKRLFDWRDQPEHIKAKVPAPIMPQRNVVQYPWFEVVSLDRLLDRPEHFVTLEAPIFRVEGHKNPWPAEQPITLNVDSIIVAKDEAVVNLFSGTQNDVLQQTLLTEIGSYRLSDEMPYREFEAKKLVEKLHLIEEDILKYFSRRS